MPKQITVEDARKKWRDYTSGFVKTPPVRTAVLGDGRGQAASNMYVPQSNNEVVWAREYIGDSKFFAVINRAKVVPAFNLPVKISYTFDELGQEQVIGVNYAGAGGSLNVTTINALGPHHLQHEFGGGDEVYIDGLLFKPGLVYPTSPASMQLQVSRFNYYWNTWKQFDTATTDSLAPFTPLSGFSRYVLIALDPEVGTLVYRLGELINVALAPFTTTAFSFSNVPAPAGNEIPLAYVALGANTTTLDWTDVQNQLGDGRLHVGFPARNILERLDQVEGYTGNPPSLATTGAAASSVDDHYEVATINIPDQPFVVGNVNLIAGANLAITQSGGSFTFTSTGAGPDFDSVGPADVAGTSGTGAGASVSRNDHIHRGLTSINMPDNTPIYGSANLISGTGASLSQSGTSITIGGLLATVGPSDIAGASVLGIGTSAAKSDHVHRGVQSINVPNNALIYGPVYILQGTGMAITQSGASISFVATGGSSGGGGPNWQGIASGRLTLTSLSPVTTADVINAASLYYTPYYGNQIALISAGTSAASLIEFEQTSLDLNTLSPNSNYDIFGFISSGSLALESNRWSTDAARTENLNYTSGILVRSLDTTRRYIGTIRITGTSGQSEDSISKRFVWNTYNQIPRTLLRKDPTASWTYNSQVWRQADNSSANQIEAVVGIAEKPTIIDVFGEGANNTTQTFGTVGIGINSTTVNSADLNTEVGTNASTNNFAYRFGIAATLAHTAIGYYAYKWLESARSGSMLFSGALTTTTQAGIKGIVWA